MLHQIACCVCQKLYGLYVHLETALWDINSQATILENYFLIEG